MTSEFTFLRQDVIIALHFIQNGWMIRESFVNQLIYHHCIETKNLVF
jgi:hypothetical protein